jgi:hypothetical protein
MAVTDGKGRNIPFFVDYYKRHSIATEDFSPSEDPSLEEHEIGRYMEKGFLVRPNADGDLYGITLHDYENNGKSLTGLVPEPFDGLANTWIECRFVKIFAHNDATYVTVATSLTVGVTI